MATREYICRVHEEDGSLWAEVLELPGCFASGDSLDELREALEEAISLYLHDRPGAGYIKRMGEVPEPNGSPSESLSSPHMEVGEMRVKVPA